MLISDFLKFLNRLMKFFFICLSLVSLIPEPARYISAPPAALDFNLPLDSPCLVLFPTEDLSESKVPSSSSVLSSSTLLSSESLTSTPS